MTKNGNHGVASATRAAELERALSQASGPLLILLSGHPDPDSIGAALAHKRVCDRLGVAATIGHVLPLSRSENRALVKLLDVPMQQFTDGAQLAAFQYLSLVDTAASEATLKLPSTVQLLTVVDHHRGGRGPDAPFVDIRTEVGATCTIYAQYFSSGWLPLANDESGIAAVATAMFFGIQTDTDDFALATSADFEAAAYLKPFTDAEVLSRVGRRTLTAETMDALGRALSNLHVVRDFAIAGVGRVSPHNRDAIATAADFILRREDIDTVLVYGVVGDRVDGSLRTNRPSVDPAAFMQSAFGLDAAGRPYGGGRNDKGGFQVPIGMLAECGDDVTLWRLVERLVYHRVARVVPEVGKLLAEGRPAAERSSYL